MGLAETTLRAIVDHYSDRPEAHQNWGHRAALDAVAELDESPSTLGVVHEAIREALHEALVQRDRCRQVFLRHPCYSNEAYRQYERQTGVFMGVAIALEVIEKLKGGVDGVVQ